MMRFLVLTILFFGILESALAKSYLPGAFKAQFDQSIKSLNGGEIKSDVLLRYQYPGKFKMNVPKLVMFLQIML